MKSKHTQGPWKVDRSDPTIIRTGEILVGSTDPATANARFDLRLYNLKTREANAHLIAAAPDMLEALELLERCYNSKRRVLAEEIPEIMVGTILPLLAKARGLK